MKKKLSFLLLGLFLCFSVVSAQTKETRNVGTFTKIAFRLPGKLYVKQGVQKVEIEASKDMLQRIETKVEGSRLVIGTHDNNWNWHNDDNIIVNVSVPNLEGLSVSGSGDAIGQSKFTSSVMFLDVSGSGSLEIEVESSGDMEANVSGSGELKAKGRSKSLHSDVSGSGRVSLNLEIAGDADLSISGSGKIEIAGRANEMETHISGSGKVLGSNLAVNRAEIHISGSGTVETNVKDELDARISGSGSVRYKGSPDKVNVNSSGSGKASKMD